MPESKINRAMQGQLSRHFSVLSVICTFMVVYIHSTTLKYSSASTWIGEIQGYFSYHIFHLSLSAFFWMSAYLMHRKLLEGGKIKDELIKRAKSIGIPYLICSLLWLVALYLAGPLLGFPIGKHADAYGSPSLLFYHLFLDPVAGQLWFLRDLMMLSLLSVVFLRMHIVFIWLLALVAYILWFVSPTPTVISLRQGWECLVSSEGAAWYLLGVLSARFWSFDVYWKKLKEFKPIYSVGFLILGLLIVYLLMYRGVGGQWMHSLAVTSCFLAIMTLPLRVYAWVPSRGLTFFASASFFVYLYHYPLIGFLNSFILRSRPLDWLHVAVYIMLPLVTVTVLSVLNAAGLRCISSLWFWIVGQRAVRKY